MPTLFAFANSAVSVVALLLTLHKLECLNISPIGLDKQNF